MLELSDIQGLIIRPYGLRVARYVFLSVRDADAGRHWLREVLPEVTSAAPRTVKPPTAVNVGITGTGLEALGLDSSSLETFPEEFRKGIAARADLLGDTGPSSPERWTGGLGKPDVHIMLLLFAQDAAELETLTARHRTLFQYLGAADELCAEDGAALPDLREHFGFRDGISQPIIAGLETGPALPGQEAPVKAGEFVLGYEDESDVIPPFPQPPVLGQNGSFLVFRKLYQDVAAWRAFLRANAQTPEEEQLLAAKMVGRWPSGAALALRPEGDDPELVKDVARNNAFDYKDDPRGFVCPLGSHLRRSNPRVTPVGESPLAGVSRHRVVRRGLPYGKPLPEGAPDDGVDRGVLGILINASISRQFEFIQRLWLNDPKFLGLSNDKDPIAGDNDGKADMVIPRKNKIRKRLKGLPRFVTVRGGGYFFLPGIRALHYLATDREATPAAAEAQRTEK